MGTRAQTAGEELVGRVWDRDGLRIIALGLLLVVFLLRAERKEC
jgi:hypothetical protein